MADQTGTRVNPKGFTVLFESENPTIDIVFIHGFTGDPKGSWTLRKSTKSHKKRDLENDQHYGGSASSPSKVQKFLSSSSSKPPHHAKVSTAPPIMAVRQSNNADESSRAEVYWPRDLLPLTSPGARVLTYGYDTMVRHFAIGDVSQNTVHDHGWNFLCAMEEIRRNKPSRPLLLVAHSLGGLIMKEALRKSQDCESVKPHLYNVVRSVIGVLFFGTPHRGANPRNLIHHVLTQLVRGFGFKYNHKVLDTLMPGGEHLREMRDEFTVLARQGSWIIYCFQEEYGLSTLFNKKAVEDESSRLDEPAIETLRHISSNHRDMCRFSGIDDPEYRKVAAAIERILHNLPTKLQPGLVGLNGSGSSNSTSTRTEDISPQRRDTEDTNKRESSHPVPQNSRDVQAKVRQTLVALLRFDQIDARLWTLRTAQSKTCNWFLQKPEYTNWISPEKLPEHHGFLWVKGKPGAGKSILMKFLLSEAKKSATSNPDAIVISFFFNAQGDHLETSTVGLYRSLLLQVFQIAPDLQGVLDGLNQNAQRLIQEHGWQIEILKNILAEVVRTLGKRTLIFFIDALDECNDDQVADLISFFEDLGERAADAKTRLHICFSSRHYPTIVVQRGLEVILEDEKEHAADITRYIKSNLKLGKSKEAEALTSAILEKSQGIFLWVALVIPLLNKEYGKGLVGTVSRRYPQV